jgi:hypothetical protein
MYVLTKSSKPRSVPVNSRSFFITTHILEPIQRSISSIGRRVREKEKESIFCTDQEVVFEWPSGLYGLRFRLLLRFTDFWKSKDVEDQGTFISS